LLHPVCSGLGLAIGKQIDDPMGFQIHQDRPEALTTQKREIIHTQIKHRLFWEIWQGHDPAQERLSSRLHPQTNGQFDPSSTTGRQRHRLQMLAQSDGHAGPGFHKVWDAFGKDFALAELIAAVEPADDQA